MRAQHTPGPWHSFRSAQAAERHRIEVNAEDGMTVAEVVQFFPAYREQSEANLALIAAAPELLEALEAATWELPVGGPTRDNALAAIAKVRGNP